MIDATGTSFHDATIRATLKQLFAMLGTPDDDSNTGEDKVNYEWVGMTSSGDVYTVYDWKEYHQIGWDETVNWHIGAHSKAASDRAWAELTSTLAKRKAVQS